MNQSTCILVVVATKSLRARRKCSDRRKQKHVHTGSEKWNTKTVCRIEVHQRLVAEKQNDYLTHGRIMFWILICALSLRYHLSSQKSNERELGSSTKVNGVSLMYRRFVHIAVGLWKILQQGHLIFVIFINFTIGFVPITLVRWPFRGKFVLGLPDILFVANNTSHYINTMVCICRFLVKWEGLFLPIICETYGTIDLCFPGLPQSAQWPQGPDIPLTCSLVLLKARCL